MNGLTWHAADSARDRDALRLMPDVMPTEHERRMPMIRGVVVFDLDGILL